MAFTLATRLVTAPDPDASKVPPVNCTGCRTLAIGATSDTPGAQLTYRVVLTDSLKNVQGTWGPFTLVCGQAAPAGLGPDWGALYLGVDNGYNQPTLPIVADLAFVKVDALNPASAKWTLTADSA